MTDSQRAPLIAAGVALIVAITGFVQAKTATEKTHEAVKSERSLGDNYQSYVEDRLSYEAALEAAFKDLKRRCKKPCPPEITINDCIALSQVEASAQDLYLKADGYVAPRPTPTPSPQPDVDLDALAAKYGYAYIK